MSGQLGELVISLKADMARFQNDMGKANRTAQDNAKAISGHFDAMGNTIKSVTELLVGFAGAASFGALIKSSIDAADSMSKMSQKVGVNIQELSGMAYAGSLADVSVEQLAKGMGKLNKAMYDAQQGGKASVDTFKALGVSVVDASGKLRKSDEVMFDVADRFAGMEDGAAKTALAMEVFGKAGADMIPLLNGGSRGLRDATDEARRFGLVLDAEAGKQAEAFNDNLTRLKSQAQGAALAFSNEMLPSLISVSDAMVKNGAGGAAIFGKAISETVRSIQEATVYWSVFADKIGAWNDTGGLLGHAFSSKKAADYKKQLQDIAIAEAQQLAEIAAAHSKAVAPVIPGSGGGQGPDMAAAARAAADARAREEAVRQSKVAGSRIKDQKDLAAAAKLANDQLREMSRLLEGDARRDGDLAGFGSGLLDNQLIAPAPQDAKFSLLGKSETMGYAGNATDLGAPPVADPAIAKAQYAAIMAQGDAQKEQLLQLETWRAEDLAIIESWDNKTLDAAERVKKAKLKIDRDYAEAKKKIDSASTEASANSLQSSMGQIGNMLMQGGKQQFKAGKEIGKMMIAIDTAKAASAAFAGAAAAGGPWGVAMGVAAGIAAMGVGTMNMARLDSIPYTPSAAGGYDIPSGVNPLTQLHEEEMVLPKGYANVIRDMAKNGGGGSRQAVEVTQVFQISPGLNGAVQAEIQRAAPMLMRMSVQGVKNAMRSGDFQGVN